MSQSRTSRSRKVTAVLLSVLAAGAVGAVAVALVDRQNAEDPVLTAPQRPVESSAGAVEFRFTRAKKPARTVVVDAQGEAVAVFTDGARTVRLTGPMRTFREPAFTKVKVTTDAWVRIAPQEWQDGAERQDWFRPWLDAALADDSPDVLAVAMQYVVGAEKIKDAAGLQVAGDAAFGPVSDEDLDGRAEQSDFYDYLGTKWNFEEGPVGKPKREHLRSLDCSGYLRMVYGYRLGYPMTNLNTKGAGLPRRAFAMAEFGPGVQLMPNRGVQANELDRLQPGDLLFFNAGEAQTAAGIEHSGIYLGVDSSGHHRFISSRSQANGPTLGDAGGASIIDGNGYWATRLRTARRI